MAETERRPVTPEKKSRSSMVWASCGCLTLATLLGCGGLAFYGVMRAKELGSELVYRVAVGALEESGLPPEDVEALSFQLERLKAGYQAGEVQLEDVERLVEQVSEGPLVPVGLVYAFEGLCLADPGLSAQERTEGSRSLQRLARGLWEGDVTIREAERLLPDRSDAGEGTEPRADGELDTEDLRAILARVEALVEEKGISGEPFRIDVAAELEKLVDAVLEER